MWVGSKLEYALDDRFGQQTLISNTTLKTCNNNDRKYLNQNLGSKLFVAKSCKSMFGLIKYSFWQRMMNQPTILYIVWNI